MLHIRMENNSSSSKASTPVKSSPASSSSSPAAAATLKPRPGTSAAASSDIDLTVRLLCSKLSQTLFHCCDNYLILCALWFIFIVLYWILESINTAATQDIYMYLCLCVSNLVYSSIMSCYLTETGGDGGWRWCQRSTEVSIWKPQI